MPVYLYACKQCKKEVDVVRPFDAQTPPTIEEGGACSVDEKNGTTPHDWEKRILPPRVAKGPGWGPGGKGRW